MTGGNKKGVKRTGAGKTNIPSKERRDWKETLKGRITWAQTMQQEGERLRRRATESNRELTPWRKSSSKRWGAKTTRRISGYSLKTTVSARWGTKLGWTCLRAVRKGDERNTRPTLLGISPPGQRQRQEYSFRRARHTIGGGNKLKGGFFTNQSRDHHVLRHAGRTNR